jgi:hypothetical protein
MQQSFYAFTTFFAFILSSRAPRLLPPGTGKILHPLVVTYLVGSLLLLTQVCPEP